MKVSPGRPVPGLEKYRGYIVYSIEHFPMYDEMDDGTRIVLVPPGTDISRAPVNPEILEVWQDPEGNGPGYLFDVYE